MPVLSSDRDWLERATTGSRQRVAEGLFLGTPTTRRDRATSAIYFSLAARRWARYNESPHHLSAFGAGLDRCASPSAALDVGTGTGDAAAMVAERHPAASVVAVDTSRRMLAIARDRHRAANVTFRRCSVARLPFGDESFDLVTCVNAVPDPIEIRRVLRPGGAVLAAATTKTLRDDTSDWVARWRAVGFRREAGADVDGGSWERYVREDGT